MQYTYTAKSTVGEVLSGIMDADGVDQVRRRLREQNLFPMNVAPKSLAKRALRFPRSSGAGCVKRRDLLNLTTQLAIMTRSGIDLVGAIHSLAVQSRNKVLRAALQQVHEDVTGGKPVSDAFSRQSHVFGEAYIASLAAGEASGKLAEVLHRLSQLLRSEIRNRAALRTMLAYPVLLSVVSMLVIMGLVCFVLPQFAEIFAQYDMELPFLTSVLISISGEIRGRIWFWFPFGIILCVGAIASRASVKGRRALDHAMLNLAVLRDVTRAVMIGRSFRLLSLMIQSGVPLLDGIRLTRRSIRNTLYRDLFLQLEDDILNGRGLATSLISAGFVPAAAAEMIITAEKTGTLALVTELMGEHYEEEGEAKMKELATILEPLIIVVMGGVVAAVVMSVMLPMFEISTLAN